MKLNTKFGELRMVLINNKMYLGFPWVDLFKLKSIKDGDFSSTFDYFYDQINIILSLVEEIKNNNKVFKI